MLPPVPFAPPLPLVPMPPEPTDAAWPPPDPDTGEQPDAQASDIPLDAHDHTDQSPDADVPIDAYAALALERNIPELAITDHVDFAPGAPAYGRCGSWVLAEMKNGRCAASARSMKAPMFSA